jgi:hypothetical protein
MRGGHGGQGVPLQPTGPYPPGGGHPGGGGPPPGWKGGPPDPNQPMQYR